MTNATAAKFDPYQAITDQVLELLEAGTAPWRKPWNAAAGMPKSLTTGKEYRGINPFLLHMSALQQGFASPYWATYKAIAERGGQVRKGEKGTLIMFWKQYADKKEVDDNGNPKRRFVLRTYKVFNVEQADAAEGKTFNVPTVAATAADHDPIAACEEAVAGYVATGPQVTFGHDHAAYAPSLDRLMMPALSSFDTPEEFYSTYFHELTHSTGHKDRLNRDDFHENVHFGDARYSKEELVAEMGSAFLAGQTGIAAVTLDNSAAYLQSWIKVLKGDSKLVVQAAALAQRAADLVLGVKFAQEETADDQAELKAAS